MYPERTVKRRRRKKKTKRSNYNSNIRNNITIIFSFGIGMLYCIGRDLKFRDLIRQTLGHHPALLGIWIRRRRSRGNYINNVN